MAEDINGVYEIFRKDPVTGEFVQIGIKSDANTVYFSNGETLEYFRTVFPTLVRNEIDEYGSKKTIINATLSTTWDGTGPYTQIFNDGSIKSDSLISILISDLATDAEYTAWSELTLKDGGQTNGSFTLKCTSDKNTITIPLTIIVI